MRQEEGTGVINCGGVDETRRGLCQKRRPNVVTWLMTGHNSLLRILTWHLFTIRH